MNAKSKFKSVGVAVLAVMGVGNAVCASEVKEPASVLPEVLVTGQGDKLETGTYKVEYPSLPKYTQPLRDTPQAITVVPRQVMEDQHATTMRDVVRNVAGISIAAGEGGVQGDNLTLRGFSARNDIFLDGMRDYGSYHRDAFNWDRVEVLRGPASVSFGRGSTGGVVNQVSKAPHLEAKKSVDFSLGTNSGQRLALDLNEPLPELGEGAAFRINMVEETASVADRDGIHISHVGVAPSLALGLGTPTRLTLSYMHQMQDDVPDYGHPWLFDKPAPVDQNNYYGFQNDFLKTNANIFTAKVEHDLDDVVTLRDQLRYGHYTRSMRASAAKVSGSPTVGTDVNEISVDRSQINRESTETFFQNQMDLLANFKLGGMDHAFTIGMEVGRETSAPLRYTVTNVPVTNLGNPESDDVFSGSYTAPIKTFSSIDSVALYALDTVSLNEQWQVVGGLRWDQLNTYYKQESTSVTELHSMDYMTSWRAALVHKPVEEGSVYFGYGTSFNPSAESFALTAGNANLEPEKNSTYELGTKWDLLNKNLLLRAAIFHTEKTNARETSGNAVLLSGVHQVQGLEVEAAGQLSPEWQLTVGYACMKSKVVSSVYYPDTVDEPLANVPLHTFNFWTTYELPWNFQVGLGGNYVDTRRSSSTTPFDTTTGLAKEVPSYWLFNAMMAYRLSARASLQLNVYNLADTFYYDQVHNGHVVPGAGRTIVASLKMDF